MCMGDKSKIEWTDATWNPIRGCSRVSEGCRNCYAESIAARFSGPGQAYEGLVEMTPSGPRWTGKVTLQVEHLNDPLRWKRPRRIFVNSMSDLFYEGVSDEWIDQIFIVMALAATHTFQILTKRPDRMAEYFGELFAGHMYEVAGKSEHPEAVMAAFANGLPNVWAGVSVEDQRNADERIPLLLQTPAALRFISAEPLLGPIDLALDCIDKDEKGRPFYLHDKEMWHPCDYACGKDIAGGIDWVIVGGESGPDARPMHPDWARSLRDQCISANVPFFFKQHGEWLHESQTSKNLGRVL